MFIFRKVFFGFNFSFLGCDFSFVGGFFVYLIDYSCMFFYSFSLSFHSLFTTILVLPLWEKLLMNFCKSMFLNSIFSRAFNDYYNSDLFSRNSKVLSLCFTKLPISNFSLYI